VTRGRGSRKRPDFIIHIPGTPANEKYKMRCE
jgi:hypothetical protein